MPSKIEGTVVAVDDQGSLITDISLERLADVPRDISVRVRCDEHETQGLFGPDHGEPAFTFLAVLGVSGYLELSVVGEHAQRMLGICVGERVQVSW